MHVLKGLKSLSLFYCYSWVKHFKFKVFLFSGGYDGYRPPFANTPNSGYGQTQFNTPRDYSNGNYQRVWKKHSDLTLDLFTSSLLSVRVVSKMSVFLFPLCCWRMVTNRTISAELVRDPEECREAALRQYDPEKAFHNDCDWLTCTTLKIQNSRMHLPQLTHVLFFFVLHQWYFSCLLNQSNACFDIWKY